MNMSNFDPMPYKRRAHSRLNMYKLMKKTLCRVYAMFTNNFKISFQDSLDSNPQGETNLGAW